MFFEFLKKKWSSINFAVNRTHIASPSVEADSEILDKAFKAFHEIRYDSNFYIPRDDYAELLDVLYYLNKNSSETYQLLRLGAKHRSRWMSSAIYAIEMLLLQIQLDVNAKIFKGLVKTLWLFCCCHLCEALV